MNRLRDAVLTIDHSLNTKRKRHITGGILLSASVLFGCLAFTVITLKKESNDYDERDN